jgi:7-keto-8-aminopelargonate synthetase-like enzyme
LAENSGTLRGQLELEGFAVPPARTQITSVVLGDPAVAVRVSDAALACGVFAQPIGPPAVPLAESGLRLTVMASHRAGELRAAARVLARAARGAGIEPAGPPQEIAPDAGGVFDFEARAA